MDQSGEETEQVGIMRSCALQGFATGSEHLEPDHRNSGLVGGLQITVANPFVLYMRKPRLSALSKVSAKSEQEEGGGQGLPTLSLGISTTGQ